MTTLPMTSRKVLIIAYEFYPMNTGGSHRPFRVAKFLKKHGIDPIVISAEVDRADPKYDRSLEEEVKSAGLEVIHVKIKPANSLTRLCDTYYFNILDCTYVRWQKALKQELDSVIRRNEVQQVIITLPPFSLCRLIPFFKKKGMAVTIDLRDAWSYWNVAPYASKLHYYLTVRRERKTLKDADQVIATSKVTLEDLHDLHPAVEAGKMKYIPNSFDQYLTAKQETIHLPPQQKIKIGYVGSFYYDPASEALGAKKWYQKKPYQWFQYTPCREEWKYRSPFYVFRTLQHLVSKNAAYADKIEIYLAGIKPSWLDAMIESCGLQDLVFHQGQLEKHEVGIFQQQMDLLLLTSSKREGKADYSIAGKTFEYFSLLTPILAFVKEGAQRDILQESGIAVVLDPDDPEVSAEKLKDLIDNGITLRPAYYALDRSLTENTFRPLLSLVEHLQTTDLAHPSRSTAGKY